MLLKKKSTSNGVRHQLNLNKSLLCKSSQLIKGLVIGKKSTNAGRGLTLGQITVRYKGSGVKKLYRLFCSQHATCFSILISIFYDARKSAFISLCYNFLTKQFFNCLNTINTSIGSIVFFYNSFPELKLGVFIPIKYVPTGSIIHSLTFNTKSKYIKAAGTFGILLQKNVSECKIKLPSGSIKTMSISTCCVLGQVSNTLHSSIVIGKAGRARLMGKRPKVRGVAMNPVDHPHGGQTSGGIPSVTPWGIPTKGKPTKKK